jgi:hypothetical protein
MISRGEVALIVANKGAALGIMSSVFFGPIIIIVIVTTIVTPILLKVVFGRETRPALAGANVESTLIKDYTLGEELELAEQLLIEAEEESEHPLPRRRA